MPEILGRVPFTRSLKTFSIAIRLPELVIGTGIKCR
jgi:hypothetical protein